jgi:hypothetical protein
MLILLTSEGTALRKAADDRMLRREQTRTTRRGGDALRRTASIEFPGEARERGVEEWRLWSALPPMGAAPGAP